MIKKLILTAVLGITFLAFPTLAIAEDVLEPPTVEQTQPELMPPRPNVVDAAHENGEPVPDGSLKPEIPSPAEVLSVNGNLSMVSSLILTSVSGVPDELRVAFSLNGRDVAVIKGGQLLYSEVFPQDQKMLLKMRIEGQGRLVGARFNFGPFTQPVLPPVIPEIIEPEPINEHTDAIEPAEEPIEGPTDGIIEELTERENPVEDEMAEPEPPIEDEPVQPKNPSGVGENKAAENNSTVSGTTEATGESTTGEDAAVVGDSNTGESSSDSESGTEE